VVHVLQFKLIALLCSRFDWFNSVLVQVSSCLYI